MAQVPTGTTFFIASSYGPTKVTTVLTNAAEAVVTCTGHGYANGDIVEIASGWGRINLRNFRIKAVTTDTFALEGMDTTSTTFFPAGAGAGTVRKASTWQQITMITAVSSNGGDPVTGDYKYLESDVRYKMNDGFNGTDYTLTLDADAISTPGYTALKNLTDVQTNTILRVVTRSGQIQLIPGTVALNESVQMNDGQINTVTASISGNNRTTRYAS